MDPNTQTTQTGAGAAATEPTQTATVTATETAATSQASPGEAATAQTTQTATEPAQTATQTAEPAIPAGYVKAEEVATERTARTAAEQTAQANEQRAIAAETRARETEIKLHAQELGFADVTDAGRFIGADVADIKSALSAVLESKPYLKGAASQPITPTSPTSPARTASALPVFTQAQISDRKFWSDNKDAIRQAMKDGRISA